MPAKPEFDPSQPYQTAEDNSGAKPAFDESQPYQAADSQSMEEPGIGGKISALYNSYVDPYVGAPLRAGAGAIENDLTGGKAFPGIGGNPITAGVKAFGNSDNAPSNYDLVSKVPDWQIPNAVPEALRNAPGPFKVGGLLAANELQGKTLKDLAAEGTGLATNALTYLPGGEILGKTGELAEEGAVTAAARHLRPTPKLAQVLGPEGVRAAAKEALDAGAIEPFTKVETTSENLNNLLDEVGAAKGDIVNQSTAKIDPTLIASKIQKEVVDPLRETPETAQIADAMEQKKSDFLDHYMNQNKSGLILPNSVSDPATMTPAQLESYKTAVQNNINYKADPNARIDAQRNYARVLKEGTEEALNKDPAFMGAKEAYGNLKNASTMADRTGALTEGGGLMGRLTDLAVGMEALRSVAEGAEGGPIGMGLAAGRALTKGKISSTLANALQGVSNTGLLDAEGPTGTLYRGGLLKTQSKRQGLLNAQ